MRNKAISFTEPNHKIFSMITVLPETPENVAAFQASGDITKEDFENLVIPHVQAKVNTYQELNFLLLLNTHVENFSFGAWWQEVLLGLKNLVSWNRAAIVTDQKEVQNFTDIFSVLMPGEFKSFPTEDLANALFWCAKGNEIND